MFFISSCKMVPRECKLSYLTFTMTVHQIQQQTLKWAGLMSLAIVEKKKKANQDFTNQLLKQDFLHLDTVAGRFLLNKLII